MPQMNSQRTKPSSTLPTHPAATNKPQIISLIQELNLTSLAHHFLPADNARYSHQQESKNPGNAPPILNKSLIDW